MTVGTDSTRRFTPGSARGTLVRLSRKPLEHFTVRSLVGLAGVVLAGIVFGVLLILVRFQFGPLYDADRGAAAALNRAFSGNEALIGVLQFVTDFGGPLKFWVIAIAVVALLARRQPRLAIFMIVAGLGALGLDPTIKELVGRLRPVVDVPVASAPGNSFPSGHALGSFVTYGALLLVFLPAIPVRWRKLAIAATATLIFLIGLTRVALGVHFVSDVLAGWLLGAAWLGVALYAFRLWRREVGAPVPHTLGEGIEPEVARALKPAPDERAVLPHPWVGLAEVLVGWVLVLGALFGFGMYVSYHAGGTFLDTLDHAVPQWFADHRTPALDDLSHLASKAGDTHSILAVSLVFCPLVLAFWRQWRPVLFLAVVMMGELTLFLASAAAVNRPRPDVPHLDQNLPTAAFPSGHIAATMCLYTTIAIVVLARTRRWWRWITVVLAVVMPLVVASSRFYRGMHHPTDFMGAMLLTALWLTVVYVAVRPNAEARPGRAPIGPTSAEVERAATIEGGPGGASAGDDVEHQDRRVRRT